MSRSARSLALRSSPSHAAAAAAAARCFVPTRSATATRTGCTATLFASRARARARVRRASEQRSSEQETKKKNARNDLVRSRPLNFTSADFFRHRRRCAAALPQRARARACCSDVVGERASGRRRRRRRQRTAMKMRMTGDPREQETRQVTTKKNCRGFSPLVISSALLSSLSPSPSPPPHRLAHHFYCRRRSQTRTSHKRDAHARTEVVRAPQKARRSLARAHFRYAAHFMQAISRLSPLGVAARNPSNLLHAAVAAVSPANNAAFAQLEKIINSRLPRECKIAL